MSDHASEIETASPATPYGPLGLGLSTVVILLCTAIGCMLLGGLLFAIVSAVVGWREAIQRYADLDPSHGTDSTFLEKMGVVVSLVVYAILSGTIVLAAWVKGRAGWRDLVAWRQWHPFRGARLVWGLLAVTIVYSIGANALVEWIHPAAKDWVHMPAAPLWGAAFVALAVVAAPITEELLFRGWLYTGLRARLTAPVTILITAIAFGAAHWESTHLYALAVFPVGLALGFVRERTGTIKATILFHAAYNGFASVLLLFGH